MNYLLPRLKTLDNRNTNNKSVGRDSAHSDGASRGAWFKDKRRQIYAGYIVGSFVHLEIIVRFLYHKDLYQRKKSLASFKVTLF